MQTIHLMRFSTSSIIPHYFNLDDIAISHKQPCIEANMNVKFLGGASNNVIVKARLSEASNVCLTETYESASVLGQTIDFPEAFQYSLVICTLPILTRTSWW